MCIFAVENRRLIGGKTLNKNLKLICNKNKTMTNEHQNQSEQTTDNEELIAYCGLYCKFCPTFISGKCEGCRINSLKGSVLYKKCQVKPCCVENGFFTCADCTIYASTKECKKYNPLLLKIASWVESSDRSKTIEIIKEKGRAKFLAYMTDRKWVVIKTKDSFVNRKFGKRINEK